MAASLTIEEERGIFVGSLHTHNGYYAGDFSRRDGRRASESSSPVITSSQQQPAFDSRALATGTHTDVLSRALA